MTVVTRNSTDGQESAMTATVAELRGEILRANVLVATSWDFFDSGGKAAAQNALAMESARADRLDGDLRRQVQAGTLAFAKWADIAKTSHEAIAYYSKETESWKMSSVLGGALAATASDVKDTAKKAADAAPSVGIYVAVVLALVVVLKVLSLVPSSRA